MDTQHWTRWTNPNPTVNRGSGFLSFEVRPCIDYLAADGTLQVEPVVSHDAPLRAGITGEVRRFWTLYGIDRDHLSEGLIDRDTEDELMRCAERMGIYGLGLSQVETADALLAQVLAMRQAGILTDAAGAADDLGDVPALRILIGELWAAVEANDPEDMNRIAEGAEAFAIRQWGPIHGRHQFALGLGAINRHRDAKL